MNVRRNIDVYANIQILKLRADQRANAATADNARLERSRSDRHAISNSQSGLFIVQRPDLWVLQDFALAVTRQESEGRRRGYRHCEAADAANPARIQRQRATAAGSRSAAGCCA